jgi:hypothetical protein
MNLLSAKLASMSHPGPLKMESGSPHPAGSGLPEPMSEGIEPRGKNQTLMASDFHSIAYTPPLFELKPAP